MKRSENSESNDNDLLRRIRERIASADKGREPKFLEGRMGTRMMSVAALQERIVAAFIDEHSNSSEALEDADTEAARLSLILATTDYVLAVESIQLAPDQKAALIRRIYAHLFSLGPLDVLFADESITTISLKGADNAAVRHRHGELTPIDPLFETESHLRQIMQRIAQTKNISFDEETPILEFGLTVGNNRKASVSIVLPPVTYEITVDIRLHPSQPPDLDQISSDYKISAQVLALIKAIAQSPHGVIIVGDTESGKTTLLSALVRQLPQSQIHAVERAGELCLPDQIIQSEVTGHGSKQHAVSFGQQISETLAKKPEVLILDEVRTGEAEAIAPILEQEQVPRQIWTFRGPTDSKRLSAALGMLARRSKMSAGEDIVKALYHKLPFVIVLRRFRGEIQLHTVAEWQFRNDTGYPTYVKLAQVGDREAVLTEEKPAHQLELS